MPVLNRFLPTMPDPTHLPMITQSEQLKELLANQRVTPRWVNTLRPFAGLLTSLGIITACLLLVSSCTPTAKASEPLNLDRLIPALEKVESNGNPDAIGDNGKAFGILQIWEVVIIDVNRAKGTAYTHADAFDPAKAREICRAYLSIYATERRLGRKPTMEDAARIWNGGPNGYKKDATNKYWQKVAKALK
jgi:hypothetical protein